MKGMHGISAAWLRTVSDSTMFGHNLSQTSRSSGVLVGFKVSAIFKNWHNDISNVTRICRNGIKLAKYYLVQHNL